MASNKGKEAKEILRKLKAENDIPGLIQAMSYKRWKGRKNYFLQYGAYQILTKMRKKAVPHLIEALTDKSLNIRKRVAKILGKIKDHQAVLPLIEALNRDSNEDVRCNAARALGEIGDSRAIDPLIHTLKDPKIWVILAAIRALGEIGDIKAVEPIETALIKMRRFLEGLEEEQAKYEKEECEYEDDDQSNEYLIFWYKNYVKEAEEVFQIIREKIKEKQIV